MKTSTGAVLVTGASSGMGKACALRLDQAGYTVFAGVRKERDVYCLRAGYPLECLIGSKPVSSACHDTSKPEPERESNGISQYKGEQMI